MRNSFKTLKHACARAIVLELVQLGVVPLFPVALLAQQHGVVWRVLLQSRGGATELRASHSREYRPHMPCGLFLGCGHGSQSGCATSFPSLLTV